MSERKRTNVATYMAKTVEIVGLIAREIEEKISFSYFLLASVFQ
jgi:hypothetical protein